MSTSGDGKKEVRGRAVGARGEGVRGSPWLAVAMRVVAVAAGLCALAWIGQGVGAAGATSTQVDAQPTTDAAAAKTEAPPSTVVVGPGPSASAPPAVASATGAARERAAATRRRASAGDPVFLNDADEADLRRLPGVGPKRAEAIVALRRRIGRFQRIEDLLRVKGVGRKTLAKWRPLVRLDSADGGAA